MKIKVIENLLCPETLAKAQELEAQARATNEGTYCPEFGRWWIGSPWYTDYLHSSIVFEMAIKLWGEDIKPSYSGMSLYCEDWSICPPHTDRPQCKYSIDLCLKQNEAWPIYVDGKKYLLEENQALAYSGTDHYHWRDRVKPGNRVTMVFFHFVNSDFVGRLN